MTDSDQTLERFIPVTVDELIADLLQQPMLADEKPGFQKFCQLVIALYNHQSIEHLTRLKNSYLPFNPDRDTITRRGYTAEQYAEIKQSLLNDISEILNKANFEELDEAKLEEAMNKTSPYGVEVSVDLNEFEHKIIFYRGIRSQTRAVRRWQKLFSKEDVEVPVYQRLFVLLKPKLFSEQVDEIRKRKGIEEKKAEKIARKKLSQITTTEDGRQIFIKLFRDIPFDDLEMLFPNTRIRMRMFDKVKLGILGGGGTAGGVAALVSKISVAASLTSQLAAIGGFVGLLWRQLKNVFHQREKYNSQLSKNLYFYNIDNNLGALTFLLDMAQSEEVKETLLSYYFLLTGKQLNRQQLDQKIERYINEQYGYAMDFEIDDGLRKLSELEIINQDTDKDISFLGPDDAIARLKKHIALQLDL